MFTRLTHAFVMGTVSALLFAEPAVARYGQYRSGCMPDEESCGSTGSLWVMGGLYVALWLWSIVTQLRQGEYTEAFKMIALGLAFAGFFWVVAQLFGS